MSLATRCIHCGTIFKIVEDQLKVSEGWVRCGRCHEVFNALPTLFDMDSEAPPPRRTPAPPTPEPAAVSAPRAAPAAPPPQPAPAPSFGRLTEDELPPEPPRPVPATTDFELDTRVPAEEMSWGRRPAPAAFDEPPPPVRSAPSASAPSPLAPPPLPESDLPSTDEADALDSRYLMPSSRERAVPRHRTPGPEFADAEFPPDALLDAEAEAHGLAMPTASEPSDEATPSASRFVSASQESPPSAPAPLSPPPAAPSKTSAKPAPKKASRAIPQTETPAFIRQAQRQAFWRQPSVRGVLTGLSLALLLSLGAQIVHQFRDNLAAQHPSWRDALTSWCELAHCTLRPPLRIDDLQVDSATLLRADSEGPHRYRLTVVVRNRANVAVAWPNVDLTLTDIAGSVVARRSFSPTDALWHDGGEPPTRFGARPSAVPPQRSTTLVWHLRAPTLQPAGYTAELFYP
ncbi:zinc-ribbon and DUF3426 domain-containing protein [Aquabacterium sp. G14]|uniref:zinc-ribbon and DUF3426 domain-containing protein n=1 Tax=Aquabacterium sp. G14 TaxID=3130164 RepID=UPI003097D8F3